jgi:hypothetical protein
MRKIRYTIMALSLAGIILFMLEPLFAQEQKPQTEGQAKITRPQIQYTADGLRDPFAGYGEGQALAQVSPEGKARPLPSLVIQGTVWGGPIAQAIINNKVLKVGDKIEGVEIIDINKEGVTVLFDNQISHLNSPAEVYLQSLEKTRR